MDMLTPEEQQTLGFYLWELEGRGWWRSDSVVPLEPSFRPFAFDPSVIDELFLADPKEIFLRAFTQGLISGWQIHAAGSAKSFL